MSRFYFDVREGETLTQDQEGLDLADLDAAEREAVHAAAEIGNDTLPKRYAPEVCVEVRDEHGQHVLSVAVTMSVERGGGDLARATLVRGRETHPVRPFEA